MERESYTEMINSLVRLRYNSIQLFDMSGRRLEFFLRPVYKELEPNYKIHESYIDSSINYANDKGMKVAVDFSLGYHNGYPSKAMLNDIHTNLIKIKDN